MIFERRRNYMKGQRLEKLPCLNPACRRPTISGTGYCGYCQNSKCRQCRNCGAAISWSQTLCLKCQRASMQPEAPLEGLERS